MDEHAAPPPDVDRELADRLQERQRLDVADRAADLGDHEVDVARLRDQRDPLLDLVGDVRHHLHRAAEVVAAALAADHRVVDPARRDVRGAAGVGVGEALVVAEVEVGLGAVLGDEHLAVLIGRHRARVDIDVGVELLQPDRQAAGDEQPPDRGRGDALAERGHDAAGDEDEPGLGRCVGVAVGRVRVHVGLAESLGPIPDRPLKRRGSHANRGFSRMGRLRSDPRSSGCVSCPCKGIRPRAAARGRGGAPRRRPSGAPSIRTSSETTSRLAELDDGGTRRVGGGVLDDREVAFRQRRDLRQVGDAQHLPAGGQLAQALADGARRVPADAGVDLVEHQRRLS